MAILGGVRFAIRAASDLPAAAAAATTDGLPTLLYGAGRTGVMLARSAQRNPGAGVRPVGFLDDDPSLREEVVGGLRVFGGLAALPDAVARTGARVLLITMPGAPGSIIRQVVDAALQLQLEVRTVPSLTHLLDGTMDAYRVRRVRVEDLLRRPMVSEHASGVDDIIRDRTVVITGGGGSIGSELARQVFALGPRRLVLVDRAESPLYLVQRELETRRLRGQGSGELRVHLANVASREAMRRLIADEAPSVIFHAAAYKHVPMMEEHPSDAVHVNMGGTMVDAGRGRGRRRRALRVRVDRQGRPADERDGREQADRRDAGRRRRPAHGPAVRLRPVRQRARLRPAASCRSSRRSSRTASR